MLSDLRYQLLFEDDTTLVPDSEYKLCRLVNEFGRACEKNACDVGISRVLRCSRLYMWVECMRLNGEPLEEIDCLF